MKRAVVIATLLVFGCWCQALTILPRHFGDVRIWRNWMPWPKLITGAAYMEITSWEKVSLPTDVDSALFRTRVDSTLKYPKKAAVLVLAVPNCEAADSTCVQEVAGRFIPQGLKSIQPSGTWQWDGPLVITLKDSSDCPIFSNLRERRWTMVMIYDSTKSVDEFNSEVEGLIRRYKRERTDRMEEMFGK